MTRTPCTSAPLVVLLAVLTLSVPTIAGAGAEDLLIEAVKHADIASVRALLAQGVDVNAPQGDGATALHWAAHRNDLETTAVLLGAGANANAANELGATPLWLACISGSGALVERLLDAGANPNAALSSGETVLMSAARAGNADAVGLLLAHSADVNATEGSRGQTALMWAVAQQHADVARMLIEHGADVHARSDVWHQLENTAGNTNPSGDFEMAHGGTTPLLFAARQGDVESARVLLAGGANVNDTAAAGTSALVVAVHSGHGALATYLLDEGADPNAADAGYTALHAAVLRSDLETVRTLIAHGAEPNALVLHGTPGRRFSADLSLRSQYIGANAFWLAAKFADVEIMRVLADAGADPLVSPENGPTALKVAIGLPTGIENRRAQTGIPPRDANLEERLSLGAARLAVELGGDVNAADQRGDTPLHDAARLGYNTIVQFLADQGADVNAKNTREQTPLSLVKGRQPLTGNYNDNDHASTADLLRRLGARDEAEPR